MATTVEDLANALGPLRLPRKYVPVEPHAKQEWFLRRDEFEVFFGGAAGPGKSWSLLMAAAQWVDTPDYHAMLFRPTLTEFEMPGGLIELSHKWFGPTDASWNGTKRQWTFPSGASIRFAYLRTQAHLTHYPGGGVSFLGFDELTLFTEQLYLGVFRLLRQALGGPLDKVPLRVRSASNPGNVGHGWVKGRFIAPDTREPGAVFVPGTIDDNPSLDYETYVNTVLGHMHPVDRARLIRGDWDVMEEGGKFKRADFQLIDLPQAPAPVQLIRYWDLAATEPSKTNPDPDWTVGLLYSLDEDDLFTVRDIAMTRQNDDDVETLVKQTAAEDGTGVSIYIEQDPGQAGKAQITNYKRRVLMGYPVHAGSTRILGRPAAKIVRAAAVSAAVGNGLVRLVRCPNHREFLGQCAMFPNVGAHDDCVDALSGAHNAVTQRGGRTTISVPRRRVATTVIDRASATRDRTGVPGR
jgi:predicted phage terminase large subunit-like protein